MSKTGRLFRVAMVFLFAAVCSLMAVEARAQGDVHMPLEKAVMSGEMAKRALTKYQISSDIARQLVDACVSTAKATNGTLSVFVLAPDGEIVASQRLDGQNTVNTQTALKKAQTALLTRQSTHASVNQFSTLDSKIVRLNMGFYLVAGGLPIVVDDQMIGSIGVGGANGVRNAEGMNMSDEMVANAALTKVLGPQPPLTPNQAADPLGQNGRGGAGRGAAGAAGGGGGRGGAGGGRGGAQ
jgi:glc operon protein GlcG